RVHVVAAPFPASLPPGGTVLPGDPAVVVLGSAGWLPNADSGVWFQSAVWPAVRAALPGAVLHLFGEEGGGARPPGGGAPPPPPAAGAAASAPAATPAVPLRTASGGRRKILGAGAGGGPVVGPPEAVSGLAAEPGRELLVARDPAGFAAAFAR